MRWVDKLNEWSVTGIRRQAIQRVEADREGSTLIRANGSQFIRWSDIQEIAVVKQPPLARGSFALAIRGVGSMVAVVDDTVAGYSEFCRELPRRLKGVVPYQKWALELTASSQDAGKVIFRRNAN